MFRDPWFSDEACSEKSSDGVLASPEECDTARRACEALYEEHVSARRKQHMRDNRAETVLNEAMMKRGTLSDMLGARVLQIRKDPFYSLGLLRHMAQSLEKKNRRESHLATQLLVDLLTSGALIPRDRALVSMARRPFVPLLRVTPWQGQNLRRMLLWFFEDQVKIIIGRLVDALQAGTRDPLEYYRDEFMKLSFKLIMDVAEREKDTLAIVINKASDTAKKIASRVPYLLGILIQKHSNMRQSVVAEVERYLYRPSITASGKYYLVIFLTQVSLSPGDTELAKVLIQVYFSFIHKLLEEKIEEEDKADKKKKKKKKKQKVSAAAQHEHQVQLKVNSKLLTQLLTGLSRAFPYLDRSDVTLFDSHLDAFYRVVFKASFNKATYAMSVLLKVLLARGRPSDKFYQALYYLLQHPNLRESSKQALFFNVLYGAIRHDDVVPRICAFVKRLLQISLLERSSFVCAALVVVSETLRIHEAVRCMIQVPEEHRLEDLEDKKNLDDKEDDNEEDDEEEERSHGKATKKQKRHANDASDVDGKALALERKRQLDKLKSLHLVDDDDDDEGEGNVGSGKAKENKVGSNNSSNSNINKEDLVGRKMYNPLKANPLRANADNSCAWELVMLSEHHHPTVSLFAKKLLDLSWIDYPGDPLLDFSLQSFLVRFSYKLPKEHQKHRADHELKFVKRHQSFADVEAPITGEEFAKLPETDVRAEELFMHKFMRVRQKNIESKRYRDEALAKRKKGGDGWDDDALANEVLEDELGFGGDDSGDDFGGELGFKELDENGEVGDDFGNDDGGDFADAGDGEEFGEEFGEEYGDADDLDGDSAEDFNYDDLAAEGFEDDNDDDMLDEDDDDGLAQKWSEGGLASVLEKGGGEEEEEDADFRDADDHAAGKFKSKKGKSGPPKDKKQKKQQHGRSKQLLKPKGGVGKGKRRK